MPRTYPTGHRTPALQVEVRLEGSAFEDEPMREAARILRRVAEGLESGSRIPEPRTAIPLFDLNGNRCGQVQLSMIRRN